MSTVDARRCFSEPSRVESSASDWSSVAGVWTPELVPEPVVSVSGDDGVETLKFTSVIESDRTPRGSSGTGLSGWEVDDRGTIACSTLGTSDVRDVTGLDGGGGGSTA